MTTSFDVEPRVIDETTQAPNWDEFGGDVQKIVLGTSPSRQRGDPEFLSLSALPDNLATRFPRLTHLYLWQIGQLEQLPELPAGLLCLEIRNCPDLVLLTNLPKHLETLVIENCAKLQDLPLGQGKFEKLTDLSVAGLPLSEETINRLLSASEHLTRFDASSCARLERISRWPAAPLERIELNGCEKLKTLPAHWPHCLRRLGLRGCSRLSRIVDFPASIDFVDLAYSGLTALPDRRQSPRTLYLFESRVLMPPASEHGSGPEENVAHRTRAYFEDVELLGQGSVRRCKLLILGNGSSGKTCLAGSLVTGRPPQEKPESTHGVQFWDWHFETEVNAVMQPIHLHLWDFGGQEIYHNTHRLFISKGAVFLLVWNPNQDGKLAPFSNSGYQDQWRPLRYWLDTIHASCPHTSRGSRSSVHTTPSGASSWFRGCGNKSATNILRNIRASFTTRGKIGASGRNSPTG
ncbi:MAG: hypothetical protein OES79_13085 [Planctomycetota bacterium]|nr:hypothetical protein [Planctomycetota bacterium]